ncbi:MAG: DUF4838 domain-containing protein [Oscillospiraceae bacterium]|jgi:hypothetical protein|nr:DUF4838 domain-containing protein [Oscillospiraceae bacterium]
MIIKICYGAPDAPVRFAARELRRYLKKIDPAREAVILRAQDGEITGGLTLRIDPDAVPVPDHTLDDAVMIDVEDGRGVIAGVNARSVLIGAYRYLRELGCAWLFPGEHGETVPRGGLNKTVRVREAASYRHRGMCIEGAVSADHIRDVLDWLPKVGMNGWFNQFMVPFAIYDRWYRHPDNPGLPSDTLTIGEVDALTKELDTEIAERGLMLHSAGHGWTCEPFGIEGTGWEHKDYYVPPESLPLLAEVNGQRGLMYGLPLNTQMCYSNDAVLDRITDAVTARCKENPHITYLHFWLADGENNHCECENCRDTRPSDFYVRYLNHLDAELTKRGIGTKIVFLIYSDLLWEPQTEKLNNPERFVLMFAPITRTYATTYAEGFSSEAAELPDYTRNRLTMPRTVSENVARLRRWQERTEVGDGFIFDYHFMWDHFRDLGGMKISRVLFEDMKGLDALGLNGMVSCQLQRAFFPTGLGVSLMAAALWDKTADFDTEAERYLRSAFGADWRKVSRYLTRLSELCDPAYLRHERPQVDKTAVSSFRKAAALAARFAETSGIHADADPSGPWGILRASAEYAQLVLDALIHKAGGGDRRTLAAKWRKLAKWVRENELRLAVALDVYYFNRTMKSILLRDDMVLF